MAGGTQPRSVPQVMVSSTFTDLVEHRKALIRAIHQHRLHANVMENDSARLVDVIDSSLQMVCDSAAYIGVISRKYGQVLDDSTRNPNGVSITELEFDTAMQLDRPILLFIMGEDHPLRERDIELDPAKRSKLAAFRKRAKKRSSDSDVERVYAVFESLEDFKEKIGPSIAELRQTLDRQTEPEPTPETSLVRQASSTPRDRKCIPEPPAFYAEPDYLGSHTFVGRASQLQELDDWAQPADTTNLLLFEAIGGNGKSMLTWEWATRRAQGVRPDWAGRFWYSFYERGAVMADFCRHAVAYMTGQSLDELRKKRTPELADLLVAQLQEQPWLLILDGLERVLVAYHRIDAAEIPDEAADAPTDVILDRDPCDAIRDEDGDLLRRLASASPSKILVSSRLTPRALLNPSGQAVPGAKRTPLPGLRPSDAEAMLRACGVSGDSDRLRAYLTTNCDNHPLVIGILGGLITDYLPDRGNFDAWLDDPGPLGGARLNLADLDLVRRRNHILRAAFEALPESGRQVLLVLALLSESVDYETLSALCSNNELAGTVPDLERRGLLQYDPLARRYDLHPVVRGVVAGGMQKEEQERYGQRVVDHFSSLPRDPYKHATTIEDVSTGLQVARTLLKLERFQDAADLLVGDLLEALLVNLEAGWETLSLLRPFFRSGWDKLPDEIRPHGASIVANDVAWAMYLNGQSDDALVLYGVAFQADISLHSWANVGAGLRNVATLLTDQRRFASADRVIGLALSLTEISGDTGRMFVSRLSLFEHLSILGHWDAAEEAWLQLDPMGRVWPRSFYREGDAEHLAAMNRFWRGSLEEKHLKQTERLADRARNRSTQRGLHHLRGAWRLDRQEWPLAAKSFQEAVRMARERRLPDPSSEAGLTLAKLHLERLHPKDAKEEAERLARQRDPAHRYLAMIWRALGDDSRAATHALAAYKEAWADGEPYVHRYELTKATELLDELDVPIPRLPPYDPAKHPPFPWEADVQAAIEKLRAEKEALDESAG